MTEAFKKETKVDLKKKRKLMKEQTNERVTQGLVMLEKLTFEKT